MRNFGGGRYFEGGGFGLDILTIEERSDEVSLVAAGNTDAVTSVGSGGTGIVRHCAEISRRDREQPDGDA